LALNDFGQQRLGRQVIDLENVGAEVGGKKLFDNVNILMSSMERLGVVGPNGVGKSTLLDVIAGRRIPTTGTVNYGSTIRIGYFDQIGETLDQDASVEEIVAGPGSRLDHRQTSLLGRFWFEPATHRAQVRTLSGGEQRRLQLMSVLASEPNVLLLDEPTNDLDLDTLRALEDWLDTFRGALVVVTHDRALLERTVEHVVALGEEGFRHLGAGEAVWEQARSESQPNNPRPKPEAKKRQRSGRSLSTLRYELQEVEVEIEKHALERDQYSAFLTDDSITHNLQQEMYRSLASTLESLENAEDRWLAISEEIEGRT
jgi:ATP-binding cassette subfamily F protein uup